MKNQPIIEHYEADRIPNPYPAGDLPWQVYHTVRNAVVRCCQKFGPTGPMGECPINAGDDTPDDWPLGDKRPLDFFVIDDQYNDERYIYLEIVRPGAFTEEWLRKLMQTLRRHAGWGVGLMPFPKAYILIFADKVMVTGNTFQKCENLTSVVQRGYAALAKPRRSRKSK